MGGYRILSRFDEGNKGEKCPRCLMVGVNFLDIGGEMLGCLVCGGVFIKRSYRVGLDVRGILEGQDRGHVCGDCGKGCKSAAGLVAHRRVNHG